VPQLETVPLRERMTRATLSQEVRLAGPTDLARIAEFLIPLGGKSFGERFPDGTAQGFYRWKYFGNPLGDAIVGIATAAGSVVSVVAATPKRIWLSGKTVLAYELGDFLTDENYRGMGLFSQLIELVCREAGAGGSSLVYVRPNDVSFPILAGKLSFHEAQRIDARRFVLPSYTLSRKTGIPAGLLRLSGLDWLLKRRCIPRSLGGAVTVVPVERFGEETDQLWQRASPGYDFALMRDSSYLNWRFSDCPTRYKIWLALRNRQAVGFLVTSASRTVPTAAIVDLFTESSDGEAVRALLATGMGSLLNSGVQLISTWTLQGSAPVSALPAAHELLQRALPFRKTQHLHLAIRVLLPQETTLPLASQKWHFTLGDSDGA
jgi:GNAT superfamily N-acetyltransferase